MIDRAHQTTLECTLSFSGRDFDPEELTRAFGISPTKIWRQRHSELATRTDLPNVEWQLTVGPEVWATFDDAVRALAVVIAGHEEHIVFVSSKLGLKVSVILCAVLLDEQPAYVISSESLCLLAEMGAELSFNIADRRELD